MTPDEVLAAYRQHLAMREGHFRLSSGLHSNVYFQSALVLAQPSLAAKFAYSLTEDFYIHKMSRPDVVIGPALGAIVIAHEVGQALHRPTFFAERVNDRFALRRGFELKPGQTVALVEDVVTTAGSILELKALVEAEGCIATILCCVIDRRPPEARHALKIWSLAQVAVSTWDPEECTLCQAGVELYVPGSRKRSA